MLNINNIKELAPHYYVVYEGMKRLIPIRGKSKSHALMLASKLAYYCNGYVVENGD